MRGLTPPVVSANPSSLRWCVPQIDPAAVKEAEDRVAKCDVTIDPRQEAPLECRLVRAIYAKSLAPGIN